MSNKFSTFDSVKDTLPRGEITSRELIAAIRLERYNTEVDAIRSAPDKDTRSALKAKLPAVTVSGVFSKRAASALVEHSGILIADVDLDDNPQLMDAGQFNMIRDELKDCNETHFLFVSPSPTQKSWGEDRRDRRGHAQGGIRYGARVVFNDVRTGDRQGVQRCVAALLPFARS